MTENQSGSWVKNKNPHGKVIVQHDIVMEAIKKRLNSIYATRDESSRRKSGKKELIVHYYFRGMMFNIDAPSEGVGKSSISSCCP